VIALGIRGVIRGVDVDTAHFSGNHPMACSIDAFDASGARSGRLSAARLGVQGAPWTTIMRQSALAANSHNLFAIDDIQSWTHVRLNIFPDGGVARLHVYGRAEIDWERVRRAGRAIDLAAIANGGLVLAASDMHFGAKDNLIMPGRATHMGDGWETRRRRGPGNDWVIVRLGAPGILRRVEIDTNHFKGNYPDWASLDGCLSPDSGEEVPPSASWHEILPQVKLHAHRRHFFSRELEDVGLVSHVRLNIFPDGGVSRLRAHGIVAPA
jgi:allantoicase